jgi:replicative DNA helicase
MSYRNKIEKLTKLDIMTLGQMPPSHLDIEKEIIGRCLFETETWIEARQLLRNKEYFYADEHQTIWDVMIQMDREGNPLTPVLLTAELRKISKLELIGGSFYVMGLMKDTHSGRAIQKLCLLLIEAWSKRELISISMQTIQNAYDDTSDFKKLLSSSNAKIEKIGLDIKQLIQIPFEKKVMNFLDWVQSPNANDKSIRWGFNALDEVTYGPQRGTLSVFGARPGTGKTTFAISSILEQTKSTKVGIWNGELSSIRFILRIVCNTSSLTAKEVITAFSENNQDKIKAIEDSANELLKNKNIFIDETIGIYVEDLVIIFRTWARLNGVTIIWLDYLNLLRSRQYKSFQNREQEMFVILKELQKCAKDENIAMIILSQLNRETLKNTDSKPNISNLKEAARVEEMAAFIGLLYRPEMHGLTQSDQNGLIEGRLDVLIRKFSDGESFKDVSLNHKLKYFQVFDREEITYTINRPIDQPLPQIEPPGGTLTELPF